MMFHSLDHSFIKKDEIKQDLFQRKQPRWHTTLKPSEAHLVGISLAQWIIAQLGKMQAVSSLFT